MAHKHSFQMISEMKEFATFTTAEQRYIRRSLEVAEKGVDAGERWSRNAAESASINGQARLYRTLPAVLRAAVPDDIAIDAAADFIGPLITLSAFDLGEGKLTSFAAYRFLYAAAWGLGAAVAAQRVPRCGGPALRPPGAAQGSASFADGG